MYLSLRLAGRSCEEQYIKHVVMSSSSTLADREYGMTLRQALELEGHIKGLDLTDYLPPKKYSERYTM
ncbi:unnamed protein product [Rhizophagus irregularis]|nr:unnamed protein product [Rhizophagus irregularis]